MARRDDGPGSAKRAELVDAWLKGVREMLETADDISIRWENDIRELSLEEMFDRGLLDGSKHYESTGFKTLEVRVTYYKAVSSGR